MPETQVVFFKERDGSVPALDWLREQVERRDRRAAAKCRAWLNMLRADGRTLRRPIADYLRDGIYELRFGFGRVNYRLLYFFHGENAVVVTHGITKESVVPDAEIDLALRRKTLFESDPERHSHERE